MRVPVVRGVIDRRILVNYRVSAAALQAVLPDPLRPQLVHGTGIGGICLIRLKDIRPLFVPWPFGLESENAAHRIAVVLPDGSEGVYIPRRDTSSALNSLTGGRLFPGVHHLARFSVMEQDDSYAVTVTDRRGGGIVSIEARSASRLPETSVFGSIQEASTFFEGGSFGYSPSQETGKLDVLELRTKSWQVTALDVIKVRSSFFENAKVFPEASVHFDSALLMRGIQHEWHAKDPLYCGELRRAV